MLLLMAVKLARLQAHRLIQSFLDRLYLLPRDLRLLRHSLGVLEQPSGFLSLGVELRLDAVELAHEGLGHLVFGLLLFCLELVQLLSELGGLRGALRRLLRRSLQRGLDLGVLVTLLLRRLRLALPMLLQLAPQRRQVSGLLLDE